MIRQAIETVYLGPTNTKGSRIKAKAQAGVITVTWDYGLDIAENHVKAAQKFCERFGWKYDKLATGASQKGGGYYHVLITEE